MPGLYHKTAAADGTGEAPGWRRRAGFGIIKGKMRPPEELKGAFRGRRREEDKRSAGIVTIVGGAFKYPHAPVLAALGARAAGAGLVHLVAPDASRYAAAVHVPEAVFTKLSATCVPPAADATAAGMGLGGGVNVQLLVTRLLSGSCGRFVLDADALAVLAEWRAKGEWNPGPRSVELVLTPHEGEAARLLGCKREKISSDRMEAAKEIARLYGATVVLKGAGTVVASPDGSRVYVNDTGNPDMALGGMGDLLAGAIAARWAWLKGDAFTASVSAVWLHGAAGDAVERAFLDPSLANTAAKLGSLRAAFDAGKDFPW